MELRRQGRTSCVTLVAVVVAGIAIACSSSDTGVTQTIPATSLTPDAASTELNAPTSTPDLTFEATDERRALRFRELEGWETDFDQKLVGLEEFISILNRDGIDPVDEPTFALLGCAVSEAVGHHRLAGVPLQGVVTDLVGGVQCLVDVARAL